MIIRSMMVENVVSSKAGPKAQACGWMKGVDGGSHTAISWCEQAAKESFRFGRRFTVSEAYRGG